MAEILHMVPINAEPADVFHALSERRGLASWWTTDVEASPEEGSIAQFKFEGGQVVMRFEIVELSSPRTIVWKVVEPAPPEWQGTTITWNLQEGEGGTNLLFGHHGWQSTEGSFPAINYNWAYYLTSLKEYLESGEGFPHDQ